MEKRKDGTNFISLDNLLEILGNPTRRLILSKLAKVTHSTSELANELGISRQAVHSQLKFLKDFDIIEELDTSKPGGKYGIKSNLSVRIDINPDYYSIEYSSKQLDTKNDDRILKNNELSPEYKKIKKPNERVKFLGEKIREIEIEINKFENERRNLLQNKQCFISELKNIMDNQYRKSLIESIKQRRTKDKFIRESVNLGEEIFYTLFFNPEKYFNRINIDKLLDDLFFADMDMDLRAKNRVSIKPLLKDLANLMDIIYEDEDDWFFDI